MIFNNRVPLEDTDADGIYDSVRVTHPGLTTLETAFADTGPAAIIHDTNAIGLDGVELVPKYAIISDAASGSNEVVAAVTGKKIRVLAYTLITDDAVTATWRSAANAISGAMEFAANGGASPAFCPVGHFETVAGEALNINLSGAVGVRGHLTYVEV